MPVGRSADGRQQTDSFVITQGVQTQASDGYNLLN
jgi:hypothetical protein